MATSILTPASCNKCDNKRRHYQAQVVDSTVIWSHFYKPLFYFFLVCPDGQILAVKKVYYKKKMLYLFFSRKMIN